MQYLQHLCKKGDGKAEKQSNNMSRDPVLFKDIFEVVKRDPDGKKFDKGDLFDPIEHLHGLIIVILANLLQFHDTCASRTCSSAT